MKKKLAIMALLILMVFPFVITPIYANYQSIGTKNGATNQENGWIMGIRQMESEGHGMGLTEIIDTDTGLATTTSNNIDVHMQKNTEYGAIAILGVSEYGKQGVGEERYMTSGALSGTEVQASTTGNLYGIYEMGYLIDNGSITKNKFEWTAAGGENFFDEFYPHLAERYVNRYNTYNSDTSSRKAGDAMVVMRTFQGGQYGAWISDNSRGFLRGWNTAFEYEGGGKNSTWYGRAIAVVGIGL